MNIHIDNMDIWQSPDALYCKHSDGQLVKIQSNGNEKILRVISHIRTHGKLDDFHDDDISRSDMNEIVRFLLDNGILLKDKDSADQKLKIGFFGNEEIVTALAERQKLKGYQMDFKPVRTRDDLKGCQFILVSSPVFDQYRQLEDIAIESYRQQLPLLYSELSPTTFTVGPLVIPLLGTASLACYMKRKTVNLRNLGLYSEFIQCSDRQKCCQANVAKYPYFEASLCLLERELQCYWDHKGHCSTHLIGKSTVIDFSRYTTESSRILKDPLSPLFNQAPYAPFNG